MTGPLRLTLAAVLVLGAAACSPHDTRLPFRLEDIPKVQKQLDKLPAEERQLVLDYLKRSKGDVVPAKYADPDAPFTARTFGEAIKLQRAWRVKHPGEAINREAARAAREAAMEPLRRALRIQIERREILSRATFGQSQGQQVLVTTYRLQNGADETITHFSGVVTVRAASDPGSLMGLDSCAFNQSGDIANGQSVEVRCGGKSASEQDQEYVNLPASALVVTWEPRSITFASGKTLIVSQ